jgi:hypothetical protein
MPYYGMLAFAAATSQAPEILPVDYDSDGVNLAVYVLGIHGRPALLSSSTATARAMRISRSQRLECGTRRRFDLLLRPWIAARARDSQGRLLTLLDTGVRQKLKIFAVGRSSCRIRVRLCSDRKVQSECERRGDKSLAEERRCARRAAITAGVCSTLRCAAMMGNAS